MRLGIFIPAALRHCLGTGALVSQYLHANERLIQGLERTWSTTALRRDPLSSWNCKTRSRSRNGGDSEWPPSVMVAALGATKGE